MSPTSRTASLLPLLLFSLGLWILPTGCESGPEYAQMTEKEKAAKIKDLREEAERQKALYSQSNDLAALESYVDLERESTKVSPTSCGFCFFRYGAALSRLGLYWKTLSATFTRDVDEKDLAPAEKAEYEAKASKYRDLAKEYFAKSNEQIQIYLTSGEPVDPQAYEWLAKQYDELGDYQKALYYLDQLAANVPLSAEDKRNVEALRKRYEELKRRQEEAEFEREIEREPARAGSPRRPRAEPAN
jgi:tetratricopeptide (TPR) repeat protein